MQSLEQRNLVRLTLESGIVHPELAGCKVYPCGHLVHCVRAFSLRPAGSQVYCQVCRLMWESIDDVGLSFYAFFANKNDNPELLMEAASWWIYTHRLDHFEKALKIKKMVLDKL